MMHLVVKSASVVAASLVSITMLAGIANAQSVNHARTFNDEISNGFTPTIPQTSSPITSKVVENSNSIDSSQKVSSQSSGIVHVNSELAHVNSGNTVTSFGSIENNLSTDAKVEDKQVISDAITHETQQKLAIDNNLAPGNFNNSSSPTIVENTAIFSNQKSNLPISAIAQKIYIDTYYEQNSSSIEYSSPSTKSAPVNPGIPVEPQTPAGLLQQLSLILSQSPIVGYFSSIPNISEVALPSVTLSMVLILLAAALISHGSFVSFLRSSGYIGAPRSDIIAAFSFFTTPLEMSFIPVRMHKDRAHFLVGMGTK